MADTNINIYIGDQTSQGTPSDPKDNNKPNPQNPNKPKGDSNAKAIGAAVAKQAITYATQQASSRVGQWVGSSQLQNQINAVGNIVGYGVSIAINPAIGLTMLALSTTFSMLDYYNNKANETRTLSVLSARAGSSLNRSR